MEPSELRVIGESIRTVAHLGYSPVRPEPIPGIIVAL